LKGHSDFVLSVAFSPNGQLLASGGKDGFVILWDVEQGSLLRKLRDGHTELVASVAFSPDGTRLASSSADGTLCLWGTH
jgi:WD40 repeat protein